MIVLTCISACVLQLIRWEDGLLLEGLLLALEHCATMVWECLMRFEEPALDKEELAGLLDELKVYCVKAYSIKRVITSLQ